ncbi:MAG: GNAT family protein [Candidatus Lokiarchaeota archaeon]
MNKEYIEKYLEWINDTEIQQFLLIYRPLSREEEEDWYLNLKNRENHILFSILTIDDNKLIGNCGITINWKDKIGVVGILIGEKDYHNKGYGTEAMSLLVEYSFSTLNLHRIELECFEFNHRAIKSYKKVGFIEEGRKRQAIFINGKYHDRVIMGLLRKEWKSKLK